ncbi:MULTISPECIES: thermonuclease family protein [Thermoactinomyces]|uniref:Thermonuclease family protein n=1 Tax=Thermoactinomyces daqus TaxID=1329516 RepID=A0A7W1XDK0_9BACL|nr:MULTISPECIES: thermonuclease family protein [Thermoactinomyces]MBA4544729.1 thermonuclease family protein [Thermoactinomyces daqus]MBH8596510.1 thermonuclease family protein [Thermoactinomyces sp. CICC 10523]
MKIGIIQTIIKWVYQLFTGRKKTSRKTRKPKKGRLVVKQAEAIDGDTIRGIVRGEKVKIRLILVDCPETRHAQKGKQPYGEEAKQFTKRRISQAKLVEVELHGTGAKDKYGRLIGHVFVNGQNLNRLLLKNGYARVAYAYGKYAYEDIYRKAEADAREKRLRIWSMKGYVQEDGFHPEVMPKKDIVADT